MTEEAEIQLSALDIRSIERPHESLMTYYALSSLMAGPFFLVVLIPLYFRYHTMHYRFSDEGVHMKWGVLFRKEINLTFARIQDIHLTSNFVERWLGLARIQIQTASGSAKAEMTIEGVREFAPLRDFLYTRMRGAKGAGTASPAPGPGTQARSTGADGGEALVEVAAALREVAVELRELRRKLASRERA